MKSQQPAPHEINPYESSVTEATRQRRVKPGRDDSLTFLVAVLLVLVALAPLLMVLGYILADLLGIGGFGDR